jgi:hypothetical protein
MRVSPPLLAFLLLVCAACDDSFHFRSVDASSENKDARTSEAVLSGALCGQSASCPCTGNSCKCSSLQSCEFAGAGCDDSSGTCNLTCANSNTCQGTCKTGCQLTCSGASLCELTMGASATASCGGSGVTCVLTVGPDSLVQCRDHASCVVTCTGACQIQCIAKISKEGELEDEPTCRYRCAGETTSRTGTGSCAK